jgi:HK97 family phage prohead protease
MNPEVRTLFTSTVKKFDRKTRTVTFLGTKETPDRTGDIIRVDGWELDNFQKNPVFLWNHNRDIPAIGKVKSASRAGNGLLFDVEFASKEVDEFADGVFKKFAEGFLSAVSVGFIPKDIEPIFSNDGQLMGLDIKRQELLELSAVNIPAHQDALAAGLGEKYTKQITEFGETKAVPLEDYRKTFEEELDMKKLEELEACVKNLTESVEGLTAIVEAQDETIKSLMTLRETVELSQSVMDTLNKSVVSLMSGEKKLTGTPASASDGSTPQSAAIDPSALLKTLDGVLSRFNEKAFTTTQVAKGEK